MVDPWKRRFEILAILTAILFILSTPVAFTLYSLERTVFDPNLYIQAMDEENVYEQLPLLLAQTLAQSAQRPDNRSILSVFRNFSIEQWQTLLVQLLPPDMLRVVTIDGVTQVVSYLNGERPDAVLSLAILKTHMKSPDGINAFHAILEAQPDCTIEQLTAMALGQQALVLCNPPETFLTFDLGPFIDAQIQRLIGLVPDQVTIIPAGSSRPAYLNYVMDLRVFMRLSPLLPILCLFIIAFLAVRRLRDWLNWWGIPLLFAGLVTFLIAALSGPLAALIFQVFFAPALPTGVPADVVELFRDLTTAIIRDALQPALLVAGIMLLAGLAMVAIGFFLRRRALREPLEYREP